MENRPGDRAAMEMVQNKMDLMQQRVQRMDQSWLEATNGLYLDSQGRIRDQSGQLYSAPSDSPPAPPLPERRSRSRPQSSKVTHTGGIVQSQATVTKAAAPPVRQFAQPLGTSTAAIDGGQVDPWKEMEHKLQQVRDENLY